MKPRSIDLETVKIPTILTQEMANQIVAENEQLYHDQIHELEKQYGGKFVTEKTLYGTLADLARRTKASKGVLPEFVELGLYPAERFWCIELSFKVKVLNSSITKLYFVRSAKKFIVK